MNIISYILCFGWLPLFLMALLGLLLGWLLWGRNKVKGDLSLQGEGALRTEADSLRARVQELEGGVKTRDTEISGLKGKLAAGAAVAAAAGTAAVATKGNSADDTDEDASYALEWRNRYLAARVKYLEGRVTEAPKAKKAAPKKAAPKKAAVKAAPKPKVLYTDGPTDGTPDDLKEIKGIGPKFEGDLNSKGIYYFRQIGAWKAADVKMVEGVIDSIPGRIKRDEWVPQARGLAKGGKARAMKSAPKKAAPKKTATKAASKPKVLYTDGPTDGTPDDLKLIKGIGPKFEGDLNGKGIYYFRQIAAWKATDVTMVEGIIDSIPGRIARDEWVKQAGGLSKSGGAAAAKKASASKGPEKGSAEWYHADVSRFHKNPDKEALNAISKSLAIVMRSRDTSLVACSDQKETDTIIRGFCAKKLGQDKDAATATVAAVCAEMKDTRFKNRVTFYYLCARQAGKLNALR